MKFTKQDALTFLIGIAVAIAWEVGVALANAEALFADPAEALVKLGIGISGAAGRYLLTYLTQRGVTGS